MLLSKFLVLLLLYLIKLATITNSCCSNFKSMGSLGVGEDETFSGYQILYPPFNFTCNNSQIIKFIFSGEINGYTFSNNQGRISKIQLWRRDSFTDYTIIKSWDLNRNDVTQRNDNLLELDLIDSEGNGPAVNADTIIGIFLPSRRRKQVDLFFTRGLSSDQFYYKSASINPSSSLNIAQMTIGDETYPKMTVELSNTLCSTTTDASIIITTMILSDTIVKSTLPIRPTVVTRSTMTFTMSDPNRSIRSSITIALSDKTVMSSAKIFSTVPVRVTTITTVFSRTQSSSVSLTSKSVPSSSAIITQMTLSGQTERSSEAESPTVGPSNSIHMSSKPQTSSQDPASIKVTSNTHPPIITPVVSTSGAVTTGTSSPIEGIGYSGYIIATVVSSAGFLVVCLILIGIAFYAICFRKRRSSNPAATEQSLTFSCRPQSQTSMYSNGAYLMNKLKKKEFIPTANDSSPNHHHYDTPNFTQSKESEETENRYSTLNRLSQFNRNPAYSITSSCAVTNNKHDYEEV